MSYVSVGIAGAGLLIKGVGAYSQARKAKKGLEALEAQPSPEYTISPELQGAYSRAQSAAQRGFSAEEEANFQQQMGRQQAGAFRQATDMGGGNLARAVSAGLGAQNIGAINQFAAQGAQLKRQNIRYADDLARALQQQKNMATSTAIQRRSQLEQVYGGALAQANENFYQGVNDATSLGVEAAQGYAQRQSAKELSDNELEMYRLKYGENG